MIIRDANLQDEEQCAACADKSGMAPIPTWAQHQLQQNIEHKSTIESKTDSNTVSCTTPETLRVLATNPFLEAVQAHQRATAALMKEKSGRETEEPSSAGKPGAAEIQPTEVRRVVTSEEGRGHHGLFDLSLCKAPEAKKPGGKGTLEELGKILCKNLRSRCVRNEEKRNAKEIELIMCGTNAHVVSVFKDYLIYDDANEFLKRYYASSEQKLRLTALYSFYSKYSNPRPNWAIINERNFLLSNIERKKRRAKSPSKRGDKQIFTCDNPENNNLFTSEFFHELDLDDQNVSTSLTSGRCEGRDSPSHPTTRIQSYLKSQMSTKKVDPRPNEPAIKLPSPILHKCEDDKSEQKDRMKSITLSGFGMGSVPQTPTPPLAELSLASSNTAPHSSLRAKCRIVATIPAKRIVNFKVHLSQTRTSSPVTATPSVPHPISGVRKAPVINVLAARDEFAMRTADHACELQPEQHTQSQPNLVSERDPDEIYPLAVKLQPDPPAQSGSPDEDLVRRAATLVSQKGQQRKGAIMRRKTFDNVPDMRGIEMLSIKYRGETATEKPSAAKRPPCRPRRTNVDLIHDIRMANLDKLLLPRMRIRAVNQSHPSPLAAPESHRPTSSMGRRVMAQRPPQKPRASSRASSKMNCSVRHSRGRQTPLQQTQARHSISHVIREGMFSSMPGTPENSFYAMQGARNISISHQIVINPLRIVVREGYLEVPRSMLRPFSGGLRRAGEND